MSDSINLNTNLILNTSNHSNSPSGSEKTDKSNGDNNKNKTHSNDDETKLDQIANRIPYYDESKSDISRQDILKQLFGDVGELVMDFSCAVESTVLLHGRMYVTNRVLCFYSNLFGLEKKIRIPYSHITVFSKENTALVFPNAIAITTYRKEYLFRSFWDRDECFRLLKDLISKVKTPDGTSVPKIAGARRSSISGNNNLSAISGSPDISATRTDLNAKNELSGPNIRKTSSASESDFDESEYIGEEEDDEVSTHEVASVEEEAKVLSDPINTDNDTLFHEEIAKSRLKITAASGKLPISLKDFATLFVEENAPYGFKQYHESVNDTNLEMSGWSEMSSNLGYCREMKFLKPVNLPGLKSTRGIKVQRYRRFGNAGLIVCSSTRLEDVPAADTFSVEDIVAVQRIDDENISVEITFEVKFIKSTLFKYVIESSTNTEMSKWLEVYFMSLGKNVKKARSDGLVSPEKSAISKIRSRTVSDHTLIKEKEKTEDKSSGPRVILSSKLTKKKGNVNISLPLPSFGGRIIMIGFWVISILSLLFFSWQWYHVRVEMDKMNGQIQEINKNLTIISSNQDFIGNSFKYQNSLIKALVSSSPNIPKNLLLELEILGKGIGEPIQSPKKMDTDIAILTEELQKLSNSIAQLTNVKQQ